MSLLFEAEFTKTGDPRSFWTERIESDDDIISLTWYDFIDPFMLVNPARSGGRTHSVYCCFIPALNAQITINGDVVEGNVVEEMRGDKPTSTACLAWSESWVRA